LPRPVRSCFSAAATRDRYRPLPIDWAANTALGRWAQPEELIGPALLLASQAGSYVTGTCLVVDGGALSRVF
jgi:NAD(P)-dependent dehydrogenase (short-subunit alcohol dehydrogenase family)